MPTIKHPVKPSRSRLIQHSSISQDLWQWAEEKRTDHYLVNRKRSERGSRASCFSGHLIACIRKILQKHLLPGR
jgi:hypothetical protein